MTRLTEYLPLVERYLDAAPWRRDPGLDGVRLTVEPLAQGEYNLNYRLRGAARDLVLRVNMGSQIDRDDQIVYEYRALQLVAPSGHTPVPLWVDDSRAHLPHGVLVMTHLPGGPLDYRRDLTAAARLLATVHQVPVDPAQNHLIREEAPLSLIYDECRRLLTTYFDSPLAEPGLRRYLQEVLAWAAERRAAERFYQQDPRPCVVNTEVNAGNFLVDVAGGGIYLVDWEMPRWGDPSQDLAHFCSPLTTLWKTAYRMPPDDRQRFVAAYTAALADAHLKDTLGERLRLREPFVLLRGISWSAMGWVVYQEDRHPGVRNADTWRTLRRYMRLDFVRELFDPHLGAGGSPP